MSEEVTFSLSPEYRGKIIMKRVIGQTRVKKRKNGDGSRGVLSNTSHASSHYFVQLIYTN